MPVRKRTQFVAALFCAGVTLLATPARAQEPVTPGVTHVMGLTDVPQNKKGTLAVRGQSLLFERDKVKTEIPISAIQDVFTGDDSQRVVRGTLQVLSTFAPYGGGRFLSLFRTKIDLLTIEFRDSAGGLHGVIFTLPNGKSAGVKKELVDAGAHTSVPLEEEKKEEKKP